MAPAPPVDGPPRPRGLVLSPFRALRYAVPDPELPTRTSPPYDVVDAAVRSACEQLSPTNVVRLILPRAGDDPAARTAADLPRLADPYEQAAATLAVWRERGVLRVDPQPAVYAYEQAPDGALPLRGLVGAVALTPPQDGVVLPHEDVMPGPVADRLALHTAVRADLEPVLLGADLAGTEVRAVLDDLPETDVLVDVRTGAARHRLWALQDPPLLQRLADALLPARAVILDGHHRWASHLARQAAAHAAGHGRGPWDSGLALLVDTADPGLRVDAVHRALPHVRAEVLADRSASVAHVEVLDGTGLPTALGALARAGAAGPALLLASGDGRVLRLLHGLDRAAADEVRPTRRSAAWRSLDVALLHDWLVPAVWRTADDPRTVLHAHDVDAALSAAGPAGTAVLLNPPAAGTVLAVAAAGERMPRKSTAFGPKPLSGLLLRTFDDA